MRTISERSKDNFPAKRVARACMITAVFTCLAFQGDSTARAQDKPAVTRIAASADNTKPTSIPQKREAWMDASDYSVTHQEVAFAVNGRTPDATNKQIAQFVKGRFAEKHVSSTYFTGREENIGVSFYFYIDGDQYGPVGITKLISTINEVASHFQAFQTLKSKQ